MRKSGSISDKCRACSSCWITARFCNKEKNKRLQENLKQIEESIFGLNSRIKNFGKKIGRYIGREQQSQRLKKIKRHRKRVSVEEPEKFLSILSKKPK